MTDERCSAICPWCGKNCGLAIPHGEWHQCLCEESPSQWKKVEQPAPSPSENAREWLLRAENWQRIMLRLRQMHKQTSSASANELYDFLAPEFDAYARQHATELQAENERLKKELAVWTAKIRPCEELLDAFADQIHSQFVSFASDRGGSYKHRMDVIKSSMLTFAKAATIETERENATLRQIVNELAKLNLSESYCRSKDECNKAICSRCETLAKANALIRRAQEAIKP